MFYSRVKCISPVACPSLKHNPFSYFGIFIRVNPLFREIIILTAPFSSLSQAAHLVPGKTAFTYSRTLFLIQIKDKKSFSRWKC